LSTVISSRLQVEDLGRGATFFGTGGGGDRVQGVEALASEVEQGKKVSLVDVQDLRDDELVACPFLMGTIAPMTEETQKRMDTLGLSKKLYDYKGMTVAGVKELEAYTGKKIDALVAIELGGGNALCPPAAAASLNIAAVDGDFVGRAIPEIPQGTPYLANMTIYPISSVDAYGDICIIKSALNTEVAERIGKLISEASSGLASQCGFLMSGKEAKEIIVRGTLSRALETGAFIRKCQESKQGNMVDALAKEVGGWVLFKGVVSAKETEDKEGYYWGTHAMKGVDDFSGQTFKIWFKNENHVSWKNDKVFVTSPDLLTQVNLDTGEPITNTNMKVGDRVGVIGLKSIEAMRTAKGLGILGPKHFGYDVDYRPIEEVVRLVK